MKGRVRALAIAVLGCAALAACQSTQEIAVLSTARVAPDFDAYRLRRVGLMPVSGVLDPLAASELQQGLLAELNRSTPFELVAFDAADLEEVAPSAPFERGAHRPATLIEISRRYRVDGILFSHVPMHRHYPPLEISLQSELVAAETGQVVWTSSVHLDASDQRVRRGLEAYFAPQAAAMGAPAWELSLLSPTRFARFAAFQVALQL